MDGAYSNTNLRAFQESLIAGAIAVLKKLVFLPDSASTIHYLRILQGLLIDDPENQKLFLNFGGHLLLGQYMDEYKSDIKKHRRLLKAVAELVLCLSKYCEASGLSDQENNNQNSSNVENIKPVEDSDDTNKRGDKLNSSHISNTQFTQTGVSGSTVENKLPSAIEAVYSEQDTLGTNMFCTARDDREDICKGNKLNSPQIGDTQFAQTGVSSSTVENKQPSAIEAVYSEQDTPDTNMFCTARDDCSDNCEANLSGIILFNGEPAGNNDRLGLDEEKRVPPTDLAGNSKDATKNHVTNCGNSKTRNKRKITKQLIVGMREAEKELKEEFKQFIMQELATGNIEDPFDKSETTLAAVSRPARGWSFPSFRRK